MDSVLMNVILLKCNYPLLFILSFSGLRAKKLTKKNQFSVAVTEVYIK